VAESEQDQAQDLQLDQGLAQAERGEDRAPSAPDGPQRDVLLMRLQDRVHQVRVDVEAACRGQLGLGGQERLVLLYPGSGEGGHQAARPRLGGSWEACSRFSHATTSASVYRTRRPNFVPGGP
jgi:hypothetical protein